VVTSEYARSATLDRLAAIAGVSEAR
jgi:hypothetical protein